MKNYTKNQTTALPLMHTIGEVAEILKVSTSTVRRRIDEGELQTVNMGGTVRVFDDSLRAYIQRSIVNRQPEAQTARA